MVRFYRLACFSVGVLIWGYSAIAISDPTKIEVELGLVLINGNSESATINAKISAEKNSGQWHHDGKIEGINTSSDNISTAERYLVSAQSDYKITEYNYIFATVKIEKDRFSGYDQRISEAFGYGRQIFQSNNIAIKAELGVGARQSELDNGDDVDEGILHVNGELKWDISETSLLSEELLIESGDDSTTTKSTTSLKLKIANSLAMKMSYILKNDSDVPVGTKETDTELIVTLVYGF